MAARRQSVFSGTMKFGLLTIPVKFYKPHFETEEVPASHLEHNGCNQPIQRPWYCSVCEKQVPYAKLVKVFDNGAVLTQSECKSARIDEKEFIVKEFVAADDVDAMHLGGDVYFIEVADAAAVDAYSAFAHALVKSERVAVASWASRGVDKIVIVRPYRKGLVAQALNFGSLMDAPDYGTYSVDSLADEVEMLSTIMSKKTVAFEPSKYKSEYVANLRQLVGDTPAEVVEIPSFFLKPSLVETLAVMAA